MEIADRLDQLMKAKRLKQVDIIRITGYTGPAVKKITDGSSEPKFGFLKSLLIEFPEVSARWLLTGEGSMFQKEKTPIGMEAQFEKLESSLGRVLVEIIQLQREVGKKIKDG